MKPAILDFSFENGCDVRVQVINGEPWFCLTDIKDALGIKNASQLGSQLDDAGICKTYIRYGGQGRNILFINEPNLYRVIFRSNKPEARQFQDWVFNVVLPTIRKNGRFELYPEPPKESGEPLSKPEYDRLVFLIDDVSKSFHFRNRWVIAIWHALRCATNNPSPNPIRTTDLPTIVHELRRILQAAQIAHQQMRYVESEFIEKVIRGGEKIDAVAVYPLKGSSATLPARLEVALNHIEKLSSVATAIPK